MTKSKGILKRHNWTPEQNQILVAMYPNETAPTIAEKLGLPVHVIYCRARSLKLTKSDEFKASEKSGRINLLTYGEKSRFQAGHATWNKDQKGVCRGGVATQFKKGIRPHNYRPVGSERTMDGYVYLKIADPKTWVPKHYQLWKETHGQYPPKGYVLIFKDGNRLNITIENLKLLSRQEFMSYNTIHQYPEPLKEVMRLAAKLRRKLNVHEQH